jgi:acyl-coenzyme A thioesterase PaaI-like protein
MTGTSMTPDRSIIDDLRQAYTHCFGCGLDNPAGLRLDGFTIADGSVTAPFTPNQTFAGFEGVLHGGIVATALDEISAWAAMLTEGVFVFTARLDIRYRRQASSDAAFTLSGSVLDRRGKRLTVQGSLISDGNIVAQSEGLFVVAQPVEEVLAGPDS